MVEAARNDDRRFEEIFSAGRNNKGNFTIELLPAEAPLAVNNFVCLARAGFYDNTPIHRIVAGSSSRGAIRPAPAAAARV